MRKHIMVINMGLKSVRCIIFDTDGMKSGTAALAINTAINDVRVEQDPAEWWEKTLQVMRLAMADARYPDIDIITVTTSASCLVCVDGNGNPTGRAIMVSDKRSVKEAKEIGSLKEFQGVLKTTGLNASSSLMLPKILWVKRNLEEVFEKTAFFLTPNDYLIYRLCGAVVTDYLNAAKYHYDFKSHAYPMKLLKTIGIPKKTLPEVVQTGTAVGTILPDVTNDTGVSQDARVVVTSYDAICSFIGSGVSEEGDASDVSGTVTVLRALSRKNRLRKSNAVYDLPFDQESFHIVGGSNNMGGGLIEWVKQCYYMNEEYPYEIMEKDARESDAGASGLIFLPYLLGERTPLWNDDARGVFFGLERMHTRKDMTRAVFESAGFLDLDIMEAIRQTGVEITSVRLSGGLSRVHLVSQIKADIMGRDVMVLSEFETTATGAAMIALVGQGVYSSLGEAAKRFVHIRMIIKPDMESNKKYKHLYELYKDTYESLKPLFIRRREIISTIRSDKEVQIENL